MMNITLPLFFSAILLSLTSLAAQAQVVPDRTLPQNSVVLRRGRLFIITGGTESETGNHLFHSFRSFSVPTRGGASFRNISPRVEQIFTRVTGGSASQIDGLIEALQADQTVSNADFFLLNPNGIVFGPGAELNVGGAFVATTANQIDFQDGTQFRADGTQNAPLLTVSVPVGLQFGSNPGPILNQSTMESDLPLLDSNGNPLPNADPVVGLRVNPNRTLALLGGEITITGGDLTAAGGQIALGSVASADRVRLVPTAQGWRFDYGDVREFGTIRLQDTADFSTDLDASGEGGGTIRFQSGQLWATGFVTVRANTLGGRDGGGLVIHADQASLDFALFSSNTSGAGDAGDVRIQTNQLTLLNSAQIETNTDAAGRGGDIIVQAREIDIIDIGRDINGKAILSDSGVSFASGLFARVNNSQTTGQGGNITLTTNQLRLQAGGQISTDTAGAGNAGRITIRAAHIQLSGVARLFPNGRPLLTNGLQLDASALSTFSQASATGRAGDLQIITDRLQVLEGATIQTSTQGAGNAGNLHIRATEAIELRGRVEGTEVRSSLLTFSGGIPNLPGNRFILENANATGTAGHLTLMTPSLIAQDGAIVAVGSFNADMAVSAGDINVTADRIRLESGSALLANTNSGNGGQANLEVADLLLLRGGSALSTTAGTRNRGGNGGNITLQADFLLSALAENNDITANAFSGNGGNIRIVTQRISGILPQPQLTPASDITASSASGVSGRITLSSSPLDPSQGLVELPTTVVDAANQIAQACPTGNSVADAGTERLSELVITGRGGLPPGPGDPRDQEVVLTDWAVLADALQALPPPSRAVSRAKMPESSTVTPLAEAQGWIRTPQGQVILTAEASDRWASALPSVHAQMGASCRDLSRRLE